MLRVVISFGGFAFSPRYFADARRYISDYVVSSFVNVINALFVQRGSVLFRYGPDHLHIVRLTSEPVHDIELSVD
jgi:hypothetical protein